MKWTWRLPFALAVLNPIALVAAIIIGIGHGVGAALPFIALSVLFGFAALAVALVGHLAIHARWRRSRGR